MLSISARDATLKAPTYILEVGLSLAPEGLYWALGLAREGPLWLPQCHWSIVDDKDFPIDQPLAEHLCGVSDFGEATAILVDVRSKWREARERIGLESAPNFFWPMDGRIDSVVPKNGDAALVDRVHLLAAGLDCRLREDADERSGAADALSDCARDTLALAAALGDGRPVVLSRLGPEGAAPLLLQHLAKAGVPCTQLTAPRLTERLHDALLPAMLASGLAVFLASGLMKLAGVLVVAPGALNAAGLADTIASDEELEWNPLSNRGEAALWNGAAALWWELA